MKIKTPQSLDISNIWKPLCIIPLNVKTPPTSYDVKGSSLNWQDRLGLCLAENDL